MRSSLPKVLHKVAGLAMVSHVLKTAAAAGGTAHAVVVGNQADAVREEVSSRNPGTVFCEQTRRLGTAHAVLAASAEIVKGYDDILVLFSDTPLLRPETLAAMRDSLAEGVAVSVLGFETDNPAGYGRLLEEQGELAAIREDKDCSDAERQVRFCNGGIMALDGKYALELLQAIGNDNAKGEHYLTDIVEIARSQGLKVTARKADEEEMLGVNNRAELARVETLWQERKRGELMESGVTMIAPSSVFLSHDTLISADVVLEPDIFFGPGVEVESGATIRAYSHLEGCTVAAGAVIGPFARLRPGADIGEGAKVGNFCEVKNASVEPGAKVNHLTYIGDARVGADANIGAGTITCNYDGVLKHHTDIGAGAFIGSNSSLVAPVTIGDGAYVASGSVITEDVPAEALALGRGRQANKEKRASAIRERLVAEKQARAKK